MSRYILHALDLDSVIVGNYPERIQALSAASAHAHAIGAHPSMFMTTDAYPDTIVWSNRAYKDYILINTSLPTPTEKGK